MKDYEWKDWDYFDGAGTCLEWGKFQKHFLRLASSAASIKKNENIIKNLNCYIQELKIKNYERKN